MDGETLPVTDKSL